MQANRPALIPALVLGVLGRISDGVPG
jgi:hypothetical protein